MSNQSTISQVYVNLGHDVLSTNNRFELLTCCQPRFFNQLIEAKAFVEKVLPHISIDDCVFHEVDIKIG